jgi:hypothetical protein
MKYSIILPCDFDLDEWFNIGIDFYPQHITANHKETRSEIILINLRELGIELDNRYLKGYQIVKSETGKIEIIVEV